MKLKKIILSLGLLGCSLFAGNINIAVAANVSYALDELKSEFNKLHPEITVNSTLASTGKLTAQVKNGAPFQVFMGANMMYPETLDKEGYSLTKPVVYAQGSLAIVSTTKRDFSKGLELLKDGSIDKIAVANPKTAPYGKAAFEALKSYGILDELKPKFVYGQSIAQTVAYLMVVADAGFIAKSSLFSSKMKAFKEGENWIDVDPKLYTPIDQGIILLKPAKNNSDAKVFYDFILSAKAKEIFKKYGYLVP